MILNFHKIKLLKKIVFLAFLTNRVSDACMEIKDFQFEDKKLSKINTLDEINPSFRDL